jgi:hypothetical protein
VSACASPFSLARKYAVLRHKVKCLPSLYPVSEVTRAFERTRLMSWRDVFYVTDDKELRAELEWGLMRKL